MDGTLNPDDVIKLVQEKKWLPLMAIVIFLIVRFLKSDTKIPIDIDPKYRFWLAYGLGVVGGIVEKVASSASADKTTWTSAIVDGLIAATMAVLAHNSVIGSLRGGKELAIIPSLIIPGAEPSPGKPASLKPPSMKDDSLTPIAKDAIAPAPIPSGDTTDKK